MKRTLRKGKSLLSVQYVDGNYTNNLFGANFTVEESEATILISIDLSGNLRVQNKAVNSYADACELAERHSRLRWVQIDESKIIEGLVAAHLRKPDASWNLELILDSKGSFKYPIEPKTTNGSLFLNVREA